MACTCIHLYIPLYTCIVCESPVLSIPLSFLHVARHFSSWAAWPEPCSGSAACSGHNPARWPHWHKETDVCRGLYVYAHTYLLMYVCIYLQHSSATIKHCVVIMASGVWFTNGREVRQTSLCFHFVSFRRPTSHPLPRPPVAVSGPVLLPRKAALDLLSLTGKWPIAAANTPPVYMHTR